MRPITDCLPPVRRRSLRKARILVCRHFQLLDPFAFLSFNFSAMPFSPPLLSLSLLLFPFLASSPLLTFFFFFLVWFPSGKANQSKKTRAKLGKAQICPTPNSKISVLLSQSLRVTRPGHETSSPPHPGGEGNRFHVTERKELFVRVAREEGVLSASSFLWGGI